MKNLLTTLMLIFSMSLFSGAIAQTTDTPLFAASDSTDSEIAVICYNTSVKVNIKTRKNKEDKVKEKKAVHEDNCFEFHEDGSISLTNNKGKAETYTSGGYELILTGNGFAYLLEAYMDGKNYKILIDYNMTYIAIFDVKKNKTKWFFMQL